MKQDKRFLNIKEAAEYSSMSVAFFRKAVRNGTVPYIRIGTKALRFDREVLDQWMASGARGQVTHEKPKREG